MLHLLQMSLFEVLTISFFTSETLGSSHSWRCSLRWVPASSGGPVPTKIVLSSSDSSCLYTSIVNLAHLAPSANAALLPLYHVQTSYLPSSHLIYPLSVRSSHVCGCFSIPSASFPPMIRSEFFNELLEVYETGVLKYYTL